MPEVTVTTGGRRLGGWSAVNIRRSLEQFCDDFTLEVTNQRVASGVDALVVDVQTVRTMADQLDTAEEVVIAIDGQTVLTGYVDTHDFQHEPGRATLRIAGRSKNGDLVDSSAQYKTGVWKKAPLQSIARDLCLPFGLVVVDPYNLSGKDFERFRLEPGESVFEALSRAANMRGCLLTCNIDGNVEMTKATAEPSTVTLELGKNILRAGVTRTTSDRFSVYRFKGQTSASDDWSGKSASELEGEVSDPDVGRHRPLTVLSAKQKARDDLGKRAVWERNVRAGRSLRYRCDVLDWMDANGKLWEPNRLVHVRDAWARVDTDLLLAAVDYTLTPNERYAALDLVDRVAYDPEPRAFRPRTKVDTSPFSSQFRGPLFNVGR